MSSTVSSSRVSMDWQNIRPLSQLAGGDQVQHLLRLDLQILLPLGEGLEPGLALSEAW